MRDLFFPADSALEKAPRSARMTQRFFQLWGLRKMEPTNTSKPWRRSAGCMLSITADGECAVYRSGRSRCPQYFLLGSNAAGLYAIK